MNKIIEYANRMRNNPTAAERRFFDRVSNLDCHAQIVIGRFIADFLFPSQGIVVEVDGGYHDEPEQLLKDTERDFWMKSKGLKIVRIRNEDADSYSIQKLAKAPKATKAVRDWLARAVAFSYQISPEQSIAPIRPVTAPKEKPVILARPVSERKRIYALFVPGEPSIVIEGRPREALRRVAGVPNAIAKRFKTKEEAQAWVDSNPSKSALHGEAWLDSLKSPGGGWTRDTLASLGVDWPPRKGWKKQLIRAHEQESK